MAVAIRSKNIILIADFFVILLISSINISLVFGNSSLYDDTDPMVQLNNETIYKQLEGSKKHWIVEFYSSWCGHCQQFAPTWKKLAWQVKNWQNYVNVGAVNCADQSNFDTCVSFGIGAYPTIKIYKPNWIRPPNKEEEDDTGKIRDFRQKEKRKIKDADESLGIVYKGDKKIDSIKRSLIDVMETQQSKFTFASYDEIMKLTSPAIDTYLYLFVVFESKDSYIGKNLILDTSSSQKAIVRRVDFTNEILTKKYDIFKNPSLVSVNLNNKRAEVLKPDGEKYLHFVDALNSVIKIIEKEPIKTKEEESTTTQEPQLVSEVNQLDILSAVGYSLKREVPKKDLNRDDITALQHWVILLSKCLPARLPFKTFLRNMDRALNEVQDSQRMLTTTDYMEMLRKSQESADFALIEDQWVSCAGSKSWYRGFPCGLWTTFHTLTVNCAARDLSRISGLNVLIGIRGFVTRFFGCVHCREHFAKMAKYIRSEVQTHDDGILWLWEGHNKVNARLQKDASTDPVHPKIQFPPPSMCRECRSSTTPEDTIKTGTGKEETKWNKPVLLHFLREHYSPDNIRVKERSLASSPDIEEDTDQQFIRHDIYDSDDDDNVTNNTSLILKHRRRRSTHFITTLNLH
ncbi:sulfhydryl oxidase 1-like isoform X2 [Clytia hemisphaerica]|uniref:Sulfhydryl oxidase n=1 Tax=Clytia hemisphaerica TaxID=252671 RepID=A0A7M5WYF9_9CNID